MSFIYNNKKLVLLFIAFCILFPLGIYGLKVSTPPSAIRTSNTVPSQIISPTKTANTLPEEDPQKKLLDYTQNRRQLSVEDEEVKFQILSTLDTSSGIVYQNENIVIEYIRSADLFQVEILTTNIDIAKEEAVSWFKNSGLSDQGVCDLPISFYLNFDIKNQMGAAAESYSPLPQGC